MELETFDDLLTILGTGKWNLYMFITASFMDFAVPIQALSGTFTCPQIPFSCQLPEDEYVGTPLEDLEGKCSIDVNKTTDGGYRLIHNTEKYKCDKFTYDNYTFHTTMTSEFDLVCDYSFMRATYFSIYNLGNLIGSPVNGFFADRRGRRQMFVVGSTVYIIMGILISWLPNMASIFAARLLMGFTHACVIQSGYLLATEACQQKHRSTVGIVIAFPWAIGTMVWGAMGYLIRDWRYLQMSCSIPIIIILPFIWFIDESPRWLIVRGNFDEATKILNKAARWNKVELPPSEKLLVLMNKIKNESNLQKIDEAEEVSTMQIKIKNVMKHIFILFRTKSIRKISFSLFVNFCVTSMVFYGMSINAVNFSADPYIYMILGGLMEVPSYTIVAPIIQKFGRKAPLIIGYTLSGTSILALAFISSEISWLVMVLAMVGKFNISSVYQILYLFATELFPTEIRQYGLGNCNVMARVGSIICPYIVDVLGPIYPWIPSIIFGSLSIVCGLVTFMLPETLNKPIPDTLAELQRKNDKNKYKTKDQDNTEALQLQ